jgi:hypothetical protein
MSNHPNKYALISKEDYDRIVGLYRMNDAIFSPDLDQVIIEVSVERFKTILDANQITAKMMDQEEAQKFIRSGWKKPALRIKSKKDEE